MGGTQSQSDNSKSTSFCKGMNLVNMRWRDSYLPSESNQKPHLAHLANIKEQTSDFRNVKKLLRDLDYEIEEPLYLVQRVLLHEPAEIEIFDARQENVKTRLRVTKKHKFFYFRIIAKDKSRAPYENRRKFGEFHELQKKIEHLVCASVIETEQIDKFQDLLSKREKLYNDLGGAENNEEVIKILEERKKINKEMDALSKSDILDEEEQRMEDDARRKLGASTQIEETPPASPVPVVSGKRESIKQKLKDKKAQVNDSLNNRKEAKEKKAENKEKQKAVQERLKKEKEDRKNAYANLNLPPLPPRNKVKSNGSIEERREPLNQWLKAIIKNPTLLKLEPVLEFLFLKEDPSLLAPDPLAAGSLGSSGRTNDSPSSSRDSTVATKLPLDIPRKLHLEVSRATNLMALDMGMWSDPFVVIKVDDKNYQTRTLNRTCNPKWEEEFEILVTPSITPFIEIEVFDEESLGRAPKFLGYSKIDLTSSPVGNIDIILGPRPNHPKDNVKSGVVHLRFEWEAIAPAFNKFKAPPPSIQTKETDDNVHFLDKLEDEEEAEEEALIPFKAVPLRENWSYLRVIVGVTEKTKGGNDLLKKRIREKKENIKRKRAEQKAEEKERELEKEKKEKSRLSSPFSSGKDKNETSKVNSSSPTVPPKSASAPVPKKKKKEVKPRQCYPDNGSSYAQFRKKLYDAKKADYVRERSGEVMIDVTKHKECKYNQEDIKEFQEWLRQIDAKGKSDHPTRRILWLQEFNISAASGEFQRVVNTSVRKVGLELLLVFAMIFGEYAATWIFKYGLKVAVTSMCNLIGLACSPDVAIMSSCCSAIACFHALSMLNISFLDPDIIANHFLKDGATQMHIDFFYNMSAGEASNILGNVAIVGGIISFIVSEIILLVQFFRHWRSGGEKGIDGRELLQKTLSNLVTTTARVAGAAGGAAIGTSVNPGLGTFVGTVIGGLTAALLVGFGCNWIWSSINQKLQKKELASLTVEEEEIDAALAS
eukprot:TRINITY_DN2435_c0_g1_i3.p1 TRINITY_DN2435_c0_g1~~TRINITY_DN2435_c0_g1_i3.p1  ORF type:complete len:993 (+),score=245.45 TRINITY_DN2435_c0_g1_i3:51-3029(+)